MDIQLFVFHFLAAVIKYIGTHTQRSAYKVHYKKRVENFVIV